MIPLQRRALLLLASAIACVDAAKPNVRQAAAAAAAAAAAVGCALYLLSLAGRLSRGAGGVRPEIPPERLKISENPIEILEIFTSR